MFAKLLMAVGLLAAVGGLGAQLLAPDWDARFLYSVLTAVGYGLFALGRHWERGATD